MTKVHVVLDIVIEPQVLQELLDVLVRTLPLGDATVCVDEEEEGE